MKNKRAWLPAVLWMGFIFLMSAASGETSGEQSDLLVDLLVWGYGLFSGGAAPSAAALETLSFLVRKAAHMTEYAVLALAFRYALSKNGVSRPGLKALLLSAAYACTDEFHQAFVPDRGPSVIDVGIDTCGAGLGLLALRIARRILKFTHSLKR